MITLHQSGVRIRFLKPRFKFVCLIEQLKEFRKSTLPAVNGLSYRWKFGNDHFSKLLEFIVVDVSPLQKLEMLQTYDLASERRSYGFCHVVCSEKCVRPGFENM